MENTFSMLNPFFESVVTSILFLLGDSDSVQPGQVDDQVAWHVGARAGSLGELCGRKVTEIWASQGGGDRDAFVH